MPDYIERIAVHLNNKGMTISHAIATAINAAKKMCSTGDLNWPGLQQVNLGSKAQACAAVAQWEAMKASAPSPAPFELLELSMSPGDSLRALRAMSGQHASLALDELLQRLGKDVEDDAGAVALTQVLKRFSV